MDNIEAPVNKKKKIFIILKYVRRVLLYTIAGIVFLIGLAVLLAYIYEDRVKEYAVAQLNKRLNSEIQVGDIDLSFIKRFPYASLTFSDVTAKDAIKTNPKGNLLKAEKVYLQFSIWDIFDKNYCIKRIEAKNALVNILVYPDGTDNYHFLKESTDTTNSHFAFDLQKVILNNVNIVYRNYPAHQDYSFLAKDAVIKGKFSDKEYTLYANGDIYIHHIKIEGMDFFTNKNAKADLEMDVVGNTYSFKESSLEVGDLSFDVAGKVIYGDTKEYADIKVKGKEVSVVSFLKELPNKYRKYFTKYECEGDFYFSCDMKGSFKGSDMPLITAAFGVNNAAFTEKESEIALKNISFKGEYSNGLQKTLNSSFIRIRDFSAVLEAGKIKGELDLKNFLQPELELVVNANLNLTTLNNFLKLEDVSSISGDLDVSASFKGLINGNAFTAQDFLSSNSSGKMTVQRMNLQLKDYPHPFTNINGRFQFSNNDIIIDELYGKVSKSDFKFSGYFKNALSFVFQKSNRLLIDADLHSNNIDLDELLTSQTSTGDTTYKLSLSDNYDLKLNVDIDHLNFKKFNASNISGKLKMRKMQMFINPLTFSAMDGTVKSLVMIDGTKPGKFLISTETSIKNVDITKLFYEFGNFGQNNMKDENLRGSVDADIQFASVWSPSLEADYNKIYALANIVIEKGELVNYAPMKGLSKFLKVDDLSDVKFATLKNQIEIKDKVISFPAMDIKSSAINIQASGTHTFDNVINYRLRILLSELLSKKARKAKKENDEFGVIEDDGVGKTTLYITVFGTVDKPEYKYDAKGVKEKIVVGFIQGKHDLKEVLKKEFGWMKKDTTKYEEDNKKDKRKEKNKDKKKEKDKVNSTFTIEWDEDKPE